jgi:hypothetical protein
MVCYCPVVRLPDGRTAWNAAYRQLCVAESITGKPGDQVTIDQGFSKQK